MANELHTEGLQYLLEAALSEEQTVPASFYLGLAVDAAPAENATLAGLTEVTGTGYARQTVASDNVDITSAAAGTNDRKATLAQQTFTATGADWVAANIWFIATTSDNTGKLLASGPLTGAPLTLNNTDTHKVTPVIQLNG